MPSTYSVFISASLSGVDSGPFNIWAISGSTSSSVATYIDRTTVQAGAIYTVPSGSVTIRVQSINPPSPCSNTGSVAISSTTTTTTTTSTTTTTTLPLTASVNWNVSFDNGVVSQFTIKSGSALYVSSYSNGSGIYDDGATFNIAPGSILTASLSQTGTRKQIGIYSLNYTTGINLAYISSNTVSFTTPTVIKTYISITGSNVHNVIAGNNVYP